MAQITRELLASLRTDIDAALKSVGEKHGVVLKSGNCSYSGNTATYKLEVGGIVGGEVITKFAQDFLSFVGLHPFTKDELGAEFQYGRETYKISGYKPRCKNPLLATKVSDGRMYRMPEDAVRALLPKK